ncbi:MAG: bile acid:sodium symporter family protein [Haloplanus sp.]
MVRVRPARLGAVVEEYLLGWVVLAVGAGLVVPELAALARHATVLLAVMIGSVSLTLTVADFRAVDVRDLAPLVAGHLLMPAIAFGVARALGLSPPLTVGFVVLGAVTPELVTPVMTTLAGGSTALSTTALVLVAPGSALFVPAVVAVLSGGRVDPWLLAEPLLVAVVVPMLTGVTLRARYPTVIGRHEDAYPALAALMVVLVIGGVTAANAGVVRTGGNRLLAVVVGAVALNLLGYGVGWVAAARAARPERIATLLSVGMRDFAVAAAVVVAAGLPTVASLPAVAFGLVEMITSAGLARRFAGKSQS